MKKYLKLIAILSVTFCTFLSTSSVVKVMALEGISTYDSVTEGGSGTCYFSSGSQTYSSTKKGSKTFELTSVSDYTKYINVEITITNGYIKDELNGVKTVLSSSTGGSKTGTLKTSGKKARYTFVSYNGNVNGYKITRYYAYA